jgi:hypothetical protein
MNRGQKKKTNSSSPQVKTQEPTQQFVGSPDKVYTIKTEDGGIILFVTKHNDFSKPSFTKPFYNKLRDNHYLKSSAKVDMLAERRSFEDPMIFWQQMILTSDQTSTYPLRWHLYVRFVKPIEENTVDFCKAWGTSMTGLLNRAGAKYKKIATYTYAGDLGDGVLGDYLTQPIVFKRIEDVYFEPGDSSYSRIDIARDDDILKLYFGDTSNEKIQRIREWYLRSIGVDPSLNPNVEQQENIAQEPGDNDLIKFAKKSM